MGARCEWWVPLAKGEWWVPEANGGHWRRHLVDASGGCQRHMVGGGVEGQVVEMVSGSSKWWVPEANGGHQS